MAADTRNGCVVTSSLPSQPSGALTCTILSIYVLIITPSTKAFSVIVAIGFAAYRRAEYFYNGTRMSGC